MRKGNFVVVGSRVTCTLATVRCFFFFNLFLWTCGSTHEDHAIVAVGLDGEQKLGALLFGYGKANLGMASASFQLHLSEWE